MLIARHLTHLGLFGFVSLSFGPRAKNRVGRAAQETVGLSHAFIFLKKRPFFLSILLIKSKITKLGLLFSAESYLAYSTTFNPFGFVWVCSFVHRPLSFVRCPFVFGMCSFVS